MVQYGHVAKPHLACACPQCETAFANTFFYCALNKEYDKTIIFRILTLGFDGENQVQLFDLFITILIHLLSIIKIFLLKTTLSYLQLKRRNFFCDKYNETYDSLKIILFVDFGYS